MFPWNSRVMPLIEMYPYCCKWWISMLTCKFCRGGLIILVWWMFNFQRASDSICWDCNSIRMFLRGSNSGQAGGVSLLGWSVIFWRFYPSVVAVGRIHFWTQCGDIEGWGNLLRPNLTNISMFVIAKFDDVDFFFYSFTLGCWSSWDTSSLTLKRL